MWPWKNKEEIIEFKEPVSVASDFKPLAYITDLHKRQVEIVGTDSKRKEIMVLQKGKENYEVLERIASSVSVDYIVSVDIIKDSIREYLVISKHNNQFQISIVSVLTGTTNIGISDSMPFLVSHRDLSPALFSQVDGKTHFIDILEKKAYTLNTSFGILRENHSSGFIDTTGNGISDLVLDTMRNGERVLEVWEQTNKEYTLRDSLVIDKKAGPIVFGDFTGTGSVDILYLSNFPAAVNVIPNKRSPYCTNTVKTDCLNKNHIMEQVEKYGYDIQNKISYEIEKTKEFVLYDKDGPVFPSVLDINRNTYPDVLAISSDENGRKEPKLLLNMEGKSFQTENVFENLPGDVNSLSFYREDRGMWSVLASSDEKSLSNLYLYKNTSDISGYYLSISTKVEKSTRSVPMIGANYACRITETGRVLVGFYPAQSGYTTLQSPVITLGLGRTNVFISSLHSRAPNEKYKIGYSRDKIVPNSELLTEITSKNHLRNSLYLNTNVYWSIALPIVLTIMLLLVAITAYFSLKTRRYSKYASRKTRYDLTFGAL